MGISTCVNDDTFGPSVEGCRGDFDLTLEFEKIILSILPSAIFIALSFPRLVLLVRKPVIAGGSSFRFTKLAATAIYAILELALLILSCIRYAALADLSIAASALSFVAAICLCALTLLEHSRSPRPSMLLSAFLFLTILFDIMQTRSLWLSAYNYAQMTFARLFLVATVWKALLILLEAQHKRRWLYWDSKSHSPEETTGLYGLGSFFWLNALFFSGFKKVLAVSDLFPLDKNVSAKFLQVSFTPKIDNVDFQRTSLARTLASTLAVPLLLPVAPRIALIGFSFCQPFLIESLLTYLGEPNGEAPANSGYGLIGATILVYTGIAISTAFYWYFQERAIFMIRACLGAAVYRKTTQAKISTADDSAALTLMSTDIEQIRSGLEELHECWAIPIQVAIACWLLQRRLGTAFAASLVVVAVCVICSGITLRYIGPRQKAWMEIIQKRVGHTSNVISNMKNLKISGMTDPVEKAIQGLRVEELNVGSKFRVLLICAILIAFTPIMLSPVFTFAVTTRNLDVTTIFTSISFLTLLSQPLSMLFQFVPTLVAAFSCLQRIQDFLGKESRYDFRDSEKATVSKSLGSSADCTPAIKIVGGSFGWDKDTMALKNINCSIPSGLTIVVGPIASGKSTLCKALLGETPVAQGKIIMGGFHHRVGYCDQVPLLLNATIKENIVGYSAINAERYAEVIKTTMLTQDLLLLPEGDRTMIGSNGLSLSGGQKQRVSIARALYLESSLLIFDDILSGLDTDTEGRVFHNVFGPTGMLRARGVTAVLCTHSVRHLPLADHIIALAADGTLVEEGTFDDLMANKQYVHGLGVDSYTHNPKPEATTPGPDVETHEQAPGTNPVASVSPVDVKNSTRIMGDAAVFMHYFRSIGAIWLVAFAVFGVICGFFYNFGTIWMKYWSEDVSSPNPKQSSSFYIGLYAMFQCLGLATLFAEAVIGLLVIINISGARLHQTTLETLITAPLRFFTTTDTGVIINLFSQDMTLIDGELPIALINTSLLTWIVVGAAAVAATSSPYLLIAYPFVLATMYSIQKFYLRTSRQLRLLDLESKSPLYTNYLDTIQGVATFRAFNWIEDAVSLNDTLLDTSQRPAYLLRMIQRWLSFVLDMVTALLSVLVVTLSTQLRSDTGFTGASMVSIMSLGGTLANLIQTYTMLETSIGAVGRIKSFSQNTLPEDQPGEDIIPAISWPERGRIEIQGVSASYGVSPSPSTNQSVESESEHNLAIRDLTLTIEPGQKVALCGRTGSGKSSTILLLLRLLDPLPSCANNISIDGMPLNTIDRSTLRRRVIAVPQDAVFLPDGTSFKANLDPFAIASDEDCQGVLETVDLWSFVSRRGGLAAGMNSDMLSQGQKQLFSLARAVLRRRIRVQDLATDVGHAYLASTSASEIEMKDAVRSGTGSLAANGGVLILDEVSSSVDIETDKVMQEIIRHEFKGYTVVMVSHRLEMVMEFDKVLVMDAGRVVEQGRPRELVEREGSRFAELRRMSQRG